MEGWMDGWVDGKEMDEGWRGKWRDGGHEKALVETWGLKVLFV